MERGVIAVRKTKRKFENLIGPISHWCIKRLIGAKNGGKKLSLQSSQGKTITAPMVENLQRLLKFFYKSRNRSLELLGEDNNSSFNGGELVEKTKVFQTAEGYLSQIICYSLQL